MRCSIMHSRRLLAAVVLFVAAAYAAPDPKLTGAALQPRNYRIVVRSAAAEEDLDAAVASLYKEQNWRIELNGAAVPVLEVIVLNRTRTIELRYPQAEIPASHSRDIAKDALRVTYTPTGTVLVVPTGPSEVGTASGRSPLAGCLAFGLTAEKEDADIDITGGFQAGVNAKPQYFWSAKAQCALLGDAGTSATGELDLSFTGEASQQRNADPDSLKAGITWRKRIAIPKTRRGWIFNADALSYEFERAVKSEAVLGAGEIQQREFLEKNSNLMWTGMARYVTGLHPLNVTLGLAGFEAGRSLTRTIKSDSRSSAQQLVSRLNFNIDAYTHLFTKGNRRIVTFHGHHTLRVPFRPEPFTRASENGGKMYLTTKPRHWTLVELIFPIANGASINLQYKRGSLPPSFEFVDHQVTIGFNLLLARH